MMKNYVLLFAVAGGLGLAACDNTTPAQPNTTPDYSYSWFDTRHTDAPRSERRASVIAASQVAAELRTVAENPASSPENILAAAERIAEERKGTVGERLVRIHAAAVVLNRKLMPGGVTDAERPLVAAQIETLQAEGAASPSMVAPALAALDGYWSDAKVASAAQFALSAPSIDSPFRQQLTQMANDL